MPQTNPNIHLRLANPADASQIAAIYNHYIQTSIITFEEVSIDAAEMARRIDDVLAKDLPWYVALDRKPTQDTILGYAYASPWRPRIAYRFSAEVTVYVAEQHHGKGLGTLLSKSLLDTLRERAFHTAIAGIALPNPQSVALHERLGFEKTAHFTQVGFKMNHWIDVGYWQLLL